MDLDEAKALLDTATRHENRDHAFGDAEVFWDINEDEVAGGYFGVEHAEVWIFNADKTDRHIFREEAARELRLTGKQGRINRNDSGGPDIYVGGD